LDKNKLATAIEPAKHTLEYLASDLHEVCGLLNELRMQLAGGGIIQARDIEPSVSIAVPKLRRAVAALNAVAMMNAGNDDNNYAKLAEVTAPSQSPLLM
jgi:hypothetical protein